MGIFTDGAFVFHISVILFVFINIVINDLCAAIRKLNCVLSFDFVSITSFLS